MCRLSFQSILLSILSVFLLSSCGVEKRTSMWWQDGDDVRLVSDHSTMRGNPFARYGLAPDSPQARDIEARAAIFAAKERRREAKRLARDTTDRAAIARGEMDRGTLRRTEASTVHAAPAPVLTTETATAKRGGWFARRAQVRESRKNKAAAPDIYVNEALIEDLKPASASIEIDLGNQRARVYHKETGQKTLVIDTPVSTGKDGYTTPTGRYTIGEKLVEKKSSEYGTWLDASGTPVPSDGQSSKRPENATTFVGADMPYWMRISGPIGLHIGEVPGYPASHGCIRVPATIQPLIFSKVGIGTQVTVVN